MKIYRDTSSTCMASFYVDLLEMVGKRKTYSPHGGLLVIYHSRKYIITLNKSQCTKMQQHILGDNLVFQALRIAIIILYSCDVFSESLLKFIEFEVVAIINLNNTKLRYPLVN